MIRLVILHRDMIRLPHLKIVKEAVKRTVIALVLFAHIACPKHFHDHGEVLFFFWCFILQIEDQCQKQHGCGRVPEWIAALRALRRRAFEQVSYKLLHIIIACDIAERIIAVALLHIDEIQHPYFVALFLKKAPCVPYDLSLRVKHHKRSIRLHDVRFAVEPRLSCTGASAYKHIEISPMLPSVYPDPHMLRQELVCSVRSLMIFPIDC